MSGVNNSVFDRALSHTLKEVEVPNIRTSIQTNYEIIRKAHDTIHEFMYLASLSLPSQIEVSWHTRSAFLTYQWEAFHQAHRSFLEALSGYYNAAYVLLRSTLELLLKGAFWECLAHKKLSNKAAVLDKDKGKYKSVKDWIDDLIKQEPSLEKDLEETSAAIFDKIAILFEDPEFQKQYIRMPPLSVIVKQLIEWQVVDMPNPFDTVYGNLYRNLSADVHVIPDATDMGRRLLSEKDFLEIEVIPNELDKYMKTLHKVVDIGIVVELSILREWIESGGKVRLEERLETLEDLELEFSLEKLKGLIA